MKAKSDYEMKLLQKRQSELLDEILEFAYITLEQFYEYYELEEAQGGNATNATMALLDTIEPYVYGCEDLPIWQKWQRDRKKASNDKLFESLFDL